MSPRLCFTECVFVSHTDTETSPYIHLLTKVMGMEHTQWNQLLSFDSEAIRIPLSKKKFKAVFSLP